VEDRVVKPLHTNITTIHKCKDMPAALMVNSLSQQLRLQNSQRLGTECLSLFNRLFNTTVFNKSGV